MLTGQIFSIERFSLHDGPGVRTSVFFKGCPLRCVWCHNPESHERGPTLQYTQRDCVSCMACAAACPEGAHSFRDGEHSINRTVCTGCGRCTGACPAGALKLSGSRLTVEQVMEEIRKDRPYYGREGGVTLSGGEPLMQPEFAAKLLKECHREGFSTCVETAGCVPQEAVLQAMPYTDLFLYDYKLDTQEQMDRFTKGSLKTVLSNLELLCEKGGRVALRCPVIPGINDTQEHFEAIARLAGRLSIKETQIMPYHSHGAQKWAQTGRAYALCGLDSVKKEQAEEYRKMVDMYRNKWR